MDVRLLLHTFIPWNSVPGTLKLSRNGVPGYKNTRRAKQNIQHKESSKNG